MRVVLQRVSKASVTVDGDVKGAINRGLVILTGIGRSDTIEDVQWMAEKCVHLRIFENEEGKFHYSLADVGGEILAVSQFTLFGDCRKGRRPGFSDAAEPEKAESLYNQFVDILREKGIHVETGVFGAMMKVEIHNDGPVSIWIDSEEKSL